MQCIFNFWVRINEVYPYCCFSIGVGGRNIQPFTLTHSSTDTDGHKHVLPETSSGKSSFTSCSWGKQCDNTSTGSYRIRQTLVNLIVLLFLISRFRSFCCIFNNHSPCKLLAKRSVRHSICLSVLLRVPYPPLHRILILRSWPSSLDWTSPANSTSSSGIVVELPIESFLWSCLIPTRVPHRR